MPVATTKIYALPLETCVALKAILVRSPRMVESGRTSIFFSTGTDSPVSADSSINNCVER